MKRLVILVLIFCFSGCDVITQRPETLIDLDKFYIGVSDSESGLIGVYVRSFQSLYVDLLFLNNKSSGDITAPVDGIQTDAGIYRPNMQPFNDAGAGAIWATSYSALAACNLLIEKVPALDAALFEEIPNETFTRRDAIVAEARFMRAYIYYNLVLLFGDVPLITQYPTSSDPIANRVARTSTDLVWEQVIKDLEYAEEFLPWNHNYLVDDGLSQTIQSKGRATRAAAKILRARIHMWNSEWQQAINKVDEVINSGQFSLASRWVTIFDATLGQNSSESIMEVQTDASGSATQFNNTGGYAWFHQDGRPRRGATEEAYDLFEGDEENLVDVRKAFSMFRSEDNPGDIYALKYRNSFPWWDPANPFNFVVFRLSECYLIKAEALNELSGPSSESLTLINVLRARTQDLDYPAGPVPGVRPLQSIDYPTKEALRKAIRDERRRELMFEGHRFYDLLRYDRYDGGTRALAATYLISYRYTANGTTVTSQTCPDGAACTVVEVGHPGKLLLPLPADQLVINPLLVQNEAYTQ